MKTTIKYQYSIPLLLLSTASLSLAVTVASFDGGPDTPWTPAGVAPIPAIASGQGLGGSDALQVTTAGVGGQANSVGFDRADVGAPTGAFPFTFDFRVGPTLASADGFSFNFFPTSLYGISGATPPLSEDPQANGVLAFGFDTWGNDAPTNDQGYDPNNRSDYNDISLYFNNVSIAANFNPRAAGVTIDDNNWHHAFGIIDMQNATVSLTVDALNIFNNVPVPGLTPYEYRVGIGARTGGETEDVFLDDILVGVPEPTSACLAALGLCVLARRRRN